LTNGIFFKERRCRNVVNQTGKAEGNPTLHGNVRLKKLVKMERKEMKKKLIFFSVGASVMLLLLSAQAIMADNPPTIGEQLSTYMQTYASQRAQLLAYLQSLNGTLPAFIPLGIQSIISTLSTALTPILQQYAAGGVFSGVTGYWYTSPPPDQDHMGYCIALASGWTALLALFVYLGATPADVVAFVNAVMLLLYSISIPALALLAFGILIAAHWSGPNGFHDWILNAGQWNAYGLVWYFFIWKTLIPYSYSHDPQPQRFTPFWKYPNLHWVSG
jgi:hypothetical protein